MFFNLNDYIKVKLNAKGIKILEDKYSKLKEKYSLSENFKIPEVDINGFTKFQAWDFMNKFGEFMGPWANLPFETEIIIEDKYLKKE